MNHGDLNPSFSCLRQGFIVLAQPTTPPQPGQSAFDNPPARQHLELMAVWRPSDDLQQPATECTSPIDQLPSIAPIGPNQPEPRVFPYQFTQHQFGSVAVLDTGSVDDDRQKQAKGVNYYMALAPTNLLAGIIAARPPFSVVLTDWLSIIAALGVGSRPSDSRTLGRKLSWMRSQVPSIRHCLKYQETVPHGGKSWGIMRQAQPLRRTYKTPLVTSRRSTLRWRPPGLAAGSRGASSLHCPSVKSLGYGLRLIPQD